MPTQATPVAITTGVSDTSVFVLDMSVLFLTCQYLYFCTSTARKLSIAVCAGRISATASPLVCQYLYFCTSTASKVRQY